MLLQLYVSRPEAMYVGPTNEDSSFYFCISVWEYRLKILVLFLPVIVFYLLNKPFIRSTAVNPFLTAQCASGQHMLY